MNCVQCGKALNQVRFCMYCGADQTATPQVPVAPPAPSQYTQGVATSNANLSLVGIILGGISIPFNFYFFSGLFFAIPAIVLGVLARKNGEKNANVAIILGSVSIGLPLVLLFFVFFIYLLGL